MKNLIRNRFIFILVLTLLVIGLFTGCLPVRVTGSGNIIERTYNFSDFNKVCISYGFTAEVKQSGAFSIEIAADDNLFEYISVKKDDDTLYIGLKPGSYERSQIQATVTMPVLQGIELMDGGKTEVSGFNSSDDLSIKLADGTKLTGSLTAGDVSITLTDGSRVELTGAANNLKIISHDGSQSYLGNFTVTDTDLNIGDGGDVTINVTGTLNATLSAGSRVNYSGNPTLGDIKLSSGSKINKVE